LLRKESKTPEKLGQSEVQVKCNHVCT
jgi:hypothetical protein